MISTFAYDLGPANAVHSAGHARVIFAKSSPSPFSKLPADVLSVILDPFQVLSLRLRMFNISCTQQAALAWHCARDSAGCSPQASLMSQPQSQLVQVPQGLLGKRGQSPGGPTVGSQDYLTFPPSLPPSRVPAEPWQYHRWL